MIPVKNDVTDVVQSIRYYLNLSKQKARFPRYGYVEKAEYWALIWGTVVMALTGFILWFPVQASALFGSWVTSVSTVIHYYEAWLATLAIIVWHFFFTIFHPHEYPMSMVWLSGDVSEEEAEENWPEWYEEIRKHPESGDEE